MLKTIFLALALCALPLHAETLPPGAVQIRDAAGNKVGTTNEGGGVISVNAHITNPGGASTVTANQGTAGGSAWPVAVSNFPGTQPISGSVSVSNFPGTQAVTGTFFQATQPVSGSLGRTWSLLNTTDSVNVGNFPATQPVSIAAPVAVTGTFFQATQPVSGSLGRTWSLLNSTDSVNVGNFPATQAVTGTFFQATQPVSIAAPVAVTGTFFQATQPVSGTVTANAGTNLNTSALALESGGHLASIDTKLTAPIIVAGQSAVGSPPSNPPISVAGVDGSGNKRHMLTDTDGTVHVNGSGVTQPISAAALPLPAGAATAGNQATANSTLSTLALQSGAQTSLDKAGSGTIGSISDTVTATTNGASACTFTTSGTFSASLIFVGVTNGVSSPTASTPFTVQGAALSLFLSANTTVVIPVGGFSQMVVKAFSYTSGTANVNWECGSGANAGFMALATAAQASSTTVGSFSLGQTTGKNRIMQTGSLGTTATTANQSVLSYTVTGGKTLYLQYFDLEAMLPIAAATSTYFGTFSVAINGTIVYTQQMKGPAIMLYGPIMFAEPLAVAAGQTVLFEVTPQATTAMTWTANFGGYEK